MGNLKANDIPAKESENIYKNNNDHCMHDLRGVRCA
jgi:hypothetical protein